MSYAKPFLQKRQQWLRETVFCAEAESEAFGKVTLFANIAACEICPKKELIICLLSQNSTFLHYAEVQRKTASCGCGIAARAERRASEPAGRAASTGGDTAGPDCAGSLRRAPDFGFAAGRRELSVATVFERRHLGGALGALLKICHILILLRICSLFRGCSTRDSSSVPARSRVCSTSAQPEPLLGPHPRPGHCPPQQQPRDTTLLNLAQAIASPAHAPQRSSWSASIHRSSPSSELSRDPGVP